MKKTMDSTTKEAVTINEKIRQDLGELIGEDTFDKLNTEKINHENFEVKNFKKPDEVRKFPKGEVELVEINGKTIGRMILRPGWKWSNSIKPIVKTESCMAPHFQYIISGVLKIKMDDGEEIELHPGDFAMISPGHDAWVVGNNQVVAIDFQGMTNYAKKIVH